MRGGNGANRSEQAHLAIQLRDCGWRSPAVHGLGKEGKDAAYNKAMQRYKPVYDGYQGEQTQPVKIWHAAGGWRTK